MRKKYICSFLFFIMLTSTIICSADKAINSNNYTTENESKKNILFEENEFDELDELVENALNSGVIKNDITPPSKLEILFTRAAIILLLKPYLYIITKYRIFKKWFTEFYYKKEDKKDKKDKPGTDISE